MSPLDYKATFRSKNKYLKFFCDNPATKWDFDTFKNHFRAKNEITLNITYFECLKFVKNDSKGVPGDVVEHIDKLMSPKEKENHAPSTIVHIRSGNVVNASSVTIDMKRIKKQKVRHESHSPEDEKKEDEKKEDEEKEDSNWLAILEGYETQKDLHKYSPEKNGVIRKAPKLDLLNAEVPKGLAKKIKKIILVIQKKKPSITYSEAVYNDCFVFRLMNVLLDEFDNHEMSPFFLPGEEELVAMTTQIKTLKTKVDHRKVYKADGIVRNKNDLEVMLLETAGAFKKNDVCKAAFDNGKGMFALLAMLKTIADKYAFASCESFKKLKLLYLQPSDCYLRLWQMKYSKNGFYEYVRVAKAVVSEEKKDEEACINSLNQFMLKMKECLNETLETMKLLEEEHEARKQEAESEICSQEIYLSDVICPRIFKISFGKHSKGFAQKITLSPDNE